MKAGKETEMYNQGYMDGYKECLNELDIHEAVAVCGWEKEIKVLQTLLVCRDAYWKIAGEEMGLRKSWRPDWEDTSIKYCIERDFDVIKKNVSNHRGYTFAFPTAEMRDAFYENFKSEIEMCKEFL